MIITGQGREGHEVRAAALSSLDLTRSLEGAQHDTAAPGLECAGIVREVGSAVRSFSGASSWCLCAGSCGACTL